GLANQRAESGRNQVYSLIIEAVSPMDFNRLTEKSQEAIQQAQSSAVEHGNQQVDVEHLLLALLDQEGGLVPSILTRADVSVDALRNRVVQEIDKLPKISGGA